MRPEEARGLGGLAGSAAAGIAAQAQELHAGIAARVFGALGPAGSGVRFIHDRIADGAYSGARRVTGALVRGGGHVYGLTRDPQAPALETYARARLAIGALNGAFGDLLERTGNPLATELTVRRRGELLRLDPSSLAVQVPGAQPRLAVFIHGLCETEDAWRLRAHRHRPYGDRLEAEHGFTSLYLRYNSGRHISHNGRRLATVLDELVRAWPVPVTDITLIGHSMGGLLARAACHYGAEQDWLSVLRRVVMLSTPHRGAPLERAANAASAAISLLPETRPFVKPLRARSVGVKDLGYGYVVDEDWEGHDPDRLLTDTGTEIPFYEGAAHYFVSATVTRDPHVLLGRALGDLLVLRASAWSQRGEGERLRFPLDRYRHLGGATHLDLLNHPAVYGLLAGWLARRALPAPA